MLLCVGTANYQRLPLSTPGLAHHAIVYQSKISIPNVESRMLVYRIKQPLTLHHPVNTLNPHAAAEAFSFAQVWVWAAMCHYNW